MLTRKYFSYPPKDRNSPRDPVSETRNHTLETSRILLFRQQKTKMQADQPAL